MGVGKSAACALRCAPCACGAASDGTGAFVRFAASEATGVAHASASPFSVGFPRMYVPLPRNASDCIGVGQERIASVSIVPVCDLSGPVVVLAFAEERESLVQAVGQTCGQDKESLTAMRRPDVRSSEQKARAPVAHAFKVALDGVEPEGNMAGDVLEEDQRGVRLGDDASHGGPEVPLVGGSAALAGERERLTRIARHDEVHCATEEPAWEAVHIAV